MRYLNFSLFILITISTTVKWASSQQEQSNHFLNCETAIATGHANIIQVAEYTSDLETPYPFAFSPDGSRVAINVGRDLLLVDATTLETIAMMRHIQDEPSTDEVIDENIETIYGLVFSPDSTMLATGSSFFSPFVLDHGSLQLWDGTNGEHLATLAENTSIMNLSFNFDGTLLVYSLNHEYIKVVEAATGNELVRFTNIAPTYGGRPTFSPTENLLTFNSMSGVELWNIDNLTQSAGLNTTAIGTGLWQIVFSPDGLLLTIPNNTDNLVELWSVETGERIRDWTTNNQIIMDIAFSPNGNMIAVALEVGIHLWNVETGELANYLPTSTRFDGLVFSPNGVLLATTSGNMVRVWDVETGAHLATFSVPRPANAPSGIYAVAISPDGYLIATQTAHQVQLWRCVEL